MATGTDQARPIDVRHLGRDRVICAWLVGDVIVDPGPTSSLAGLLAGLGDVRPRALALTHIHLDHAGAAGTLARRWPDLEVWVHERGARHLVDPTKLLASARRLYGEDMDRLWGEVEPVPEERVRVLRGGETLGPFAVAYTPGHASHHVSYLHEPSGRAFVGDVAGVRIPPAELTLPPTPPPDVDLEAWAASLDAVAAWRPQSLGLTHFGSVEDPPAQLQTMREQLARFGEHARRLDEEVFCALVEREVAGAADAATAASYVQALPPDQSWAGLRRYWSKRELSSGAG
ncbi:MAG: MBL fold metallo-hydrolase [Actinobacteria bacterium]|nr:MBL fold metallo-hydrolase [Actinomycetota bacterium]